MTTTLSITLIVIAICAIPYLVAKRVYNKARDNEKNPWLVSTLAFILTLGLIVTVLFVILMNLRWER